MKSELQKLLATHQPNAVGFGGLGISANPVGWIGTESGHPDCPGGVWSLASDKNPNCGDPSGTVFYPKTCDTTLQNGDHWFWTPPSTSVRSLEDLKSVYHQTVGSNGVLELDFAIDRDGIVNPDHEKVYRAFGSWISSCYNKKETAAFTSPEKCRWQMAHQQRSIISALWTVSFWEKISSTARKFSAGTCMQTMNTLPTLRLSAAKRLFCSRSQLLLPRLKSSFAQSMAACPA